MASLSFLFLAILGQVFAFLLGLLQRPLRDRSARPMHGRRYTRAVDAGCTQADLLARDREVSP